MGMVYDGSGSVLVKNTDTEYDKANLEKEPVELLKIKQKSRSVLTIFLSVLILLGVIMPTALAIQEELDENAEMASVSEFSTTPMIAAGARHTVALRSDGTVWTWGDNSHGQLGDGVKRESPYLPVRSITPIQTKNLTNIIAVTTDGDYTVALRYDGTVWTWGRNYHGQLGDGTSGRYSSRSTPIQVQSLTNAVAVTASSSHTLALQDDGTVWAWGDNTFGQLGDGTTTNRTTPVQVRNLTNITAIAAGTPYSVALRDDGTVWIWGWIWDGRHEHERPLGDNTAVNYDTTNRTSIPIQVQNITNAVAVAASGHTAVLRDEGTVWIWGDNFRGQLGNGTTIGSTTPMQVQYLTNIIAIAVALHAVALRDDGTVWVWGSNIRGELADGTFGWDNYRTIPVQVQSIRDAIAIAASGHTAILRDDGSVWTWGNNSLGQLGDGAGRGPVFHPQLRATPVQVLGVNGVGYLNLKYFSIDSEDSETEQSRAPELKDVSPCDWFYREIRQGIDLGIITGTTDENFQFEPERNVTRAEFVVMLGRLHELRVESIGLPDKGRFYERYLNWAIVNDIIHGNEYGEILPHMSLTREQMVTIAHRYLIVFSLQEYMSMSDDFAGARTSYADWELVSWWAQDAVSSFASRQLLPVYDEFPNLHNRFNFKPLDYATRAEALSILVEIARRLD